MKIRTANLTGAQLDWAVATCEYGRSQAHGEKIKAWVLERHAKADAGPYTSEWLWCGPIIEREYISFRKYHNPSSPAHGKYYAKVCRESGQIVHWTKHDMVGPTALVASMRCYVALKLGEEVDIPEEIV